MGIGWHGTGARAVAALALGTALLAGAAPRAGAADDWPTSPDFAAETLVPSQLIGSLHLGWEDRGGGWITDDGPGGDQLWQLIFERNGAVTVAIVVPESYTANGSVETWRVRTSLLMDRKTDVPMAWDGCMLASGVEQPVYARWAPGREPTQAWTFVPEAARFEPLSAGEIDCYEFGPE